MAIEFPSSQQPPGGIGVSGANNGLDLDAGIAVLGQNLGEVGNPASLLSDRQIPMGGFRILINDGFNDFLDLDPVGQTAVIGASGNNRLQLQSGINETLQYFQGAGTRALNLDLNSQTYQIGDVDGAASGTQLILDGASQSMRLTSFLLGDALNIVQNVGLYQLGDVNDVTNGTALEIDDTLQTVNIVSLAPGSRFLSIDLTTGLFGFGDVDGSTNWNFINIDNINNSLVFRSQNSEFLTIDVATGLFQIGDIDGFGAQTFLSIDNAGSSIVFSSGGDSGIDININAGIYQIGDLSGHGNSSQSLIVDSQRQFTFGSSGGNYLNLDPSNNIFEIGDLGAQADGTVLSVNQSGGTIGIDNTAHNAGILINGVAGFTGTVAAPTTITVNGGIVTNVA